MKMGFGKNQKIYHKTSNIVNIVGSMTIILLADRSSFEQI